MPLTHYFCPDNKKVAIKDCLASCPNRCMSLPTLQYIADGERPFNGVFSTTQLLNGTRYSYLTITKEYAQSPDNYAFALLGTRHHKKLESVAKRLEMTAEKYLDGDIKGILDLLVEDGKGGYELWDYKTSGSYKIANALGLTREAVHIQDWELQLNNYRIELERLGLPISRMVIQATARDGGTFTARRYGIFKNIHLIEIKRLDDELVIGYFADKKATLQRHLTEKALPPMCSYDERWANNKCLRYCPVVEFCPEGAAMAKSIEKKVEDMKV